MEEKVEDKKIVSESPPLGKKYEFQINKYLTLKLFDKFIKIYVNGEIFNQCRYLLIIDPYKQDQQEFIDSIDEAEGYYNNELEAEVTPGELGITKGEEFWAHCSNLQAWVENNYDTRLLHSNLSFPLLKKLTEVGDDKARKVFKDEIAQRFVRGYIPVMRYLFKEKFLDYLTIEEFELILDELDYDSLNINWLLLNIEDYRASRYGTQFLLRIRKEFLEFFTNNPMYVEVDSYYLDRSEYSPIVITPDRQFFIRGSNDGKLKVFGIFNGELERIFGDHQGQAVFTLAISRDGKYVASSSDNLVKVWDYKTGVLRHIFEGHQDHVNSLTFNPFGSLLVSGSGEDEMNECAIKVWDLEKWKLKVTEGSHWRTISALSFSPNGEYLVSGAFDKTVNVWNSRVGRLITTLVGHKSSVDSVAITDNKQVISSCYTEGIKVWDVDTGKVLNEMNVSKALNLKKEDRVVSFVLTPDQKYIISGSLGSTSEDGGLLAVWRLSDGEIIQALPIFQNSVGHSEELNQVTISNDGQLVFSASRDRMVKVWMEFKEYMDFQELIQNS